MLDDIKEIEIDNGPDNIVMGPVNRARYCVEDASNFLRMSVMLGQLEVLKLDDSISGLDAFDSVVAIDVIRKKMLSEFLDACARVEILAEA